MSDKVTIEVDGKVLEARRGAMLIEATDAAGIFIPRFCYHPKLTVAANCRMCLVEVEKMPKPMPACATPVMDGMKVFTRSARAREAQKATMEFLLINHPLDCPVCDQGGECELQDLAMGYGSDVSRYSEAKRVVPELDIGPLVQTELTRCIHCTRCVRFGEEIAGLRELGATGRGEEMTIGTYVQHTLVSELSGNIIDLCPVGALTSKPFRFRARPWELRQAESIAPHDSVGSNIHLHLKGREVLRVVPRENEGVNEVWISDRDRYSYTGLHSEDRLTRPLIRQQGQWHEVDWSTALEFAGEGLRRVIQTQGAERLGALAAPNATTEELYLLQKLMRALGSENIDHRLRQRDFSDDEVAPVHPWLGMPINELEQLDCVLLIGAWPRHQQPLLNHRIRKAALAGAAVMALNPVDWEFNFPLAGKRIVPPSHMVREAALIAAALAEEKNQDLPEAVAALCAGAEPEDSHREMASRLAASTHGAILLGPPAMAQADAASLRAVAGEISRLAGLRLGYLPEAANSVGAWIAGALPHRGAAGEGRERPGMNAAQMIESGLEGWLLLNLEPDRDALAAGPLCDALERAPLVVALSSWRTPALERCADVLLPIAQFAETAGTFINCEGRWQGFQGAAEPPGEAQPAWKVLRVLGTLLGLSGFEQASAGEVRAELEALGSELQPDNDGRWAKPSAPAAKEGVWLITEVPMFSLDGLVRRSGPLQAMPTAASGEAFVAASLAQKMELAEGDVVRVTIGGTSAVLPARIDERLPRGCVLLQSGHESVAGLDLRATTLKIEKESGR